MEIIIEKKRHYFKIYSKQSKHFFLLLSLLQPFITKLTTKKKVSKFSPTYRKVIESIEVDKEFFIIEERNKLIRFNISYLDPIYTSLSINKTVDKITILDKSMKRSDLLKLPNIDISINSDFKPRDDQKPFISLLDKHNPTTLIDARTGFGKSFIFSYFLTKFNKRVGFILLSRYLDKWVEDLEKYTNIDKKDIFIVDGGKKLDKLINEDIDFKIVLFSITTLTRHLKKYLNNLTNVSLEDIFTKLKLGMLVNDESHQEFHNVFKISLYSPTYMFVGMTATLISESPKLNDVYKALFPLKYRNSDIINYAQI